MKKIKWGIIGPGKIAKRFAHDMAYSEHGELHAVASRSLEKAKDFATEHNAPKAYGSYEDLYNDSETDIIYVATPHNFHFQHVSDILNAGKNVLCEKPLTVSPDESHRLIELAGQTGNYLAEGMWTFFLPAINQAFNWAKEGRIGTIRHIKADFGFIAPYNEKNRLYNPELAGGSLLDIGCYTIAITWLFLKKDPVNMTVLARKAPTGVDSDLTMLFEFDGAEASLSSSFITEFPNYATIVGEKGFISIPLFWRAKECYLYENGVVTASFKDNSNSHGFNFEIDSVSRDIMEGKKESDVMPHAISQKLQELMHKVKSAF